MFSLSPASVPASVMDAAMSRSPCVCTIAISGPNESSPNSTREYEPVGTYANIHHSRRTLATQSAERGRPYVPSWAVNGRFSIDLIGLSLPECEVAQRVLGHFTD